MHLVGGWGDVLGVGGMGWTDAHTHHVGTHSRAGRPPQTQRLALVSLSLLSLSLPICTMGAARLGLQSSFDDTRRTPRHLKPSRPSKTKLRINVASLGARRMVLTGGLSLKLILEQETASLEDMIGPHSSTSVTTAFTHPPIHPGSFVLIY